MHTRNRSWNVPLAIGLFGGAVLIGGAILAYPETRHPESHVDVSDPIATRPFPSYPGEAHPSVPGSKVSAEPEPHTGSISSDPLNSAARSATPHAPLPAPSSVGGGPRGEGSEAPDTDDEPPRGTRLRPIASATEPVTATTSAPVAAAPAGDAGAPTTSAAGDASVASSAAPVEAGLVTISDAGNGLMAVGDVAVDPNTPYLFPTFGAPGAAGTATTGTASANSTGITSGTSTGGGTSGGGGGVSTTNTTLLAPMLVTVSGTLDRFWTGAVPYLRSGDVVIAPSSPETLAWSERARTDAPLATYAVTFPSSASLESALNTGLPAALTVVGLQSLTGVTESALTSVATKTHEAGRRLFVSTKIPADGPPLAAIGANADIVEIVASAANGTELAEHAKSAAATMGTKPRIYVRLPTALASATAARTAANSIVGAVPSAGVALTGNVQLSDYRKR